MFANTRTQIIRQVRCFSTTVPRNVSVFRNTSRHILDDGRTSLRKHVMGAVREESLPIFNNVLRPQVSCPSISSAVASLFPVNSLRVCDDTRE